jgi:primosomal protein N' (replication factor Y)
MISKGLDFPNVTLVGVVDADTVLHQPDMRSSERTFQLIAQVAGRTGRSRKGGRVLVQTCCPTEPAIVLAAQHDYVKFATAELIHRRQLLYPPFEHFVRVILRGPNEAEVRGEAQRLGTEFKAIISKLGLPVRLLGPAPAPVARLKGNFRYHFQLAAAQLEPLQEVWHALRDQLQLPRSVEYTVDVDPLNSR